MLSSCTVVGGVIALAMLVAGNTPGDYRATVSGDGLAKPIAGTAYVSGLNTGVFVGYPAASDTANFEVWNSNKGFLRFGTNAAERMRIDQNGRVGIGSAAPLADLHVNKAVGGAGGVVTVLASTGNDGTAQLMLTEDTANTGVTVRYDGVADQLRFLGRQTGADVGPHMVINRGNGAIGVGLASPAFRMDLPNIATDIGGRGRANAWTTYSSVRWKEHIEPIEHALDKVMALRGVYFDWKQDHGGGHDVGFIAEEVGRVVPELVTWEDDGRFAKSMKYDRITAITVNALQELRAEKDAEIDRLEAANQVQQRLIDELLRRVELLERKSTR